MFIGMKNFFDFFQCVVKRALRKPRPRPVAVVQVRERDFCATVSEPPPDARDKALDEPFRASALFARRRAPPRRCRRRPVRRALAHVRVAPEDDPVARVGGSAERSAAMRGSSGGARPLAALAVLDRLLRSLV